MSLMTDDDDELTLDLSDFRPSTKDRLLRTLLSRESKRKKLAAKRPKEEDDGDGDDDDGSLSERMQEMEKNSSLHSEKRGSPAPMPVKESDFKEGDMRRALASMPKDKPRTRK